VVTRILITNSSTGIGVAVGRSSYLKKILFTEVGMLTPLKRERLLRQMSLYDVRGKTGISISKLSLVERGIEHLNDDEKKRLARALGVRLQDLFPMDETVHG
jgi:hypothetical protein